MAPPRREGFSTDGTCTCGRHRLLVSLFWYRLKESSSRKKVTSFAPCTSSLAHKYIQLPHQNTPALTILATCHIPKRDHARASKRHGASATGHALPTTSTPPRLKSAASSANGRLHRATHRRHSLARRQTNRPRPEPSLPACLPLPIITTPAAKQTSVPATYHCNALPSQISPPPARGVSTEQQNIHTTTHRNNGQHGH